MKTGRETPEEVGLAREQLQTASDAQGAEARTHPIAYPTTYLHTACYRNQERQTNNSDSHENNNRPYKREKAPKTQTMP